MGKKREPIPRSVQMEVFFRDGWLCYLCLRPTIFPMTFKLLSEMMESELPDINIAYWNDNWRRDKSPLLDELGVEVDHVHAFAKGGAHDISNFSTICAKCNVRKNDQLKESFLEKSNPHKPKGKHGEPIHWDGMASLFVVLAKKIDRPLTHAEKDWLKAIEGHYAELEDGENKS